MSSNVVSIRGHRPCVNCGEPALNHALAMSEQRCRDGSGKRFEPGKATPPPRGTLTKAFDDEEAAVMTQLFRTLYAGGDVRQLLKRAALVGVAKKFSDLHEQHTEGKKHG